MLRASCTLPRPSSTALAQEKQAWEACVGRLRRRFGGIHVMWLGNEAKAAVYETAELGVSGGISLEPQADADHMVSS